MTPAAPPDKELVLRQKTAAGLLLWLFFGLSFIALGYSIALSLILGIVGAGAGVFIVAWWYDESALPAPEGFTLKPGGPRPQKNRSSNAPGIEEAQHRRRIAEAVRRAQANKSRPGGQPQSWMAKFFRRRR